MWLLSPEQTARLTALQRQRDLQRIGDALATAFAEAKARLGTRWDEFVAHGATRAATYGLDHALCAARFEACWVVCGADFESRQPWAAAILTDERRPQGAKAYQLCVQVLEQLRSARQVGQPTADDFAESLRSLDGQLSSAGKLASLLPRERIRLGAACDVDAVELRLVDPEWRQHYTAVGGPWRREGCAPTAGRITLVQDPLAETAPAWPEQITLLSRPAADDTAARLRVRIKAEHRCDPTLHPFLQWIEPTGARLLRGDVAADTTLTVHAPTSTEVALPHIGEEDSPQFSVLSVSSCGLRSRGVPIGELSTRLAAYNAAQHLIAWRREQSPPWQLPLETPPSPAAVRCRREIDGRVADSAAWVEGFQDLDAQLHDGLARLLTAWERESGVSDGKLAVDAGLLVGSAGITWGWAERAQGMSDSPYMRLEGLLDLVACRLGLRFSGTLARNGSRSLLTLSTDGSVPLVGPWTRSADDAALFVVAAKWQAPVHQTFDLVVQPVADAGLAVLSCSGPLRGAISGVVGLEQRPDGPGLRWFVRLSVEPVLAPLCIRDPLLGVQTALQPLLPAQPLVAWSQA